MGFKKIDDQGVLPGPRALLMCGFSESEHIALQNHLEQQGLKNIQVQPCRYDSLDQKLEEVLNGRSQRELVEAEKLPPVIVWSGIEHRELDSALQDFTDSGLKRPIFATATEPNLNFTVKELLNHLLSEQKAMREAMNQSE
jgi:hypothetical protein